MNIIKGGYTKVAKRVVAVNIDFVIPNIYYSDGVLIVDVDEERTFGILTQDTFECEIIPRKGFLMYGVFYMVSEESPYDTVEVHLQFKNTEMYSITIGQTYLLKIIELEEIPNEFAKLTIKSAETDPIRIQQAIDAYNRYKGGFL